MPLLEEIKLDLFFNELSLDGVETIGIESIIVLAKVYRALRNYNITTCRIRNCRKIICIFLETMLIYVMNKFNDSGGHFHGT